ncbi:hypothetical protein KCU91_g42, partial [Aureobasidium melanogenum]
LIIFSPLCPLLFRSCTCWIMAEQICLSERYITLHYTAKNARQDPGNVFRMKQARMDTPFVLVSTSLMLICAALNQETSCECFRLIQHLGDVRERRPCLFREICGLCLPET